MALTKTLGELIDEIRDRGEIRETYVDRDELVRMINTAWTNYYQFVTRLNPEVYLSSQTVTITSGTDNYALSDDFWRALGVDVLDGSDYYPMHRFNWGSRNKTADYLGDDKRSASYRLAGSTLYILPSPTWSGTVRVWYVAAPTLLSANSDTVEGWSGFEEYIVLHTLIQFAGKEESDATLYASQLNAIKDDMRAMVSDNDDQEPDRIRDAWFEDGYSPFFWAYPRLGKP